MSRVKGLKSIMFNLSIITPDGKVFDDQVEAVVAPGAEGSFGILKNHIPIVSLLQKGILKLTQNGNENFYCLDSGVLEFSQNNCTLVVDQAIQSADKEEAKKNLKNLIEQSDQK